jgi:hypothetical protein
VKVRADAVGGQRIPTRHSGVRRECLLSPHSSPAYGRLRRSQSPRQPCRRARPEGGSEMSARGRSAQHGTTRRRPRVPGVTLGVENHNARAVPLYQSLGYLPENYPLGWIRAERRVEASRIMRTRQRRAKTPSPQDAQPRLFDLLQYGWAGLHLRQGKSTVLRCI